MNSVTRTTAPYATYVMACNWVLIIMCFSVSCYQLYVWETYKDFSCESELTSWFVVHGTVGIVYSFFAMATLLSWKHLSEKWQLRLRVAKLIFELCMLCLLIWLAIMFYSINPNTHVCPPQLYSFVFWVLTLVWTVWAIVIFFAIVVCCLLAFSG